MEEDLTKLLSSHTSAIQSLTHTLREVISGVYPHFTLDVSIPLGVLYFKYHGVACALTPHKTHVNLHFYKGLELTDPEGLLQGSGKKLRHLKFTPQEDMDEALISRLVLEAVALNEK
ncbi:MAG: DUF1801 domain-containing protein [Anaerolineae bacterium]|nr:DUF1801 domain-containing protein [Anaerolineae bacterium]